MSKKIKTIIKLQIQGGKANPAPPVGPALGQHGVNIMNFCKAYNAATQDKAGTVVPVEITVYEDASFTFVCKTAPASRLILKAAGLKSGANMPGRQQPKQISKDHIVSIAKEKMVDLNAYELDSAVRVISGTARSMGFEVV